MNRGCAFLFCVFVGEFSVLWCKLIRYHGLFIFCALKHFVSVIDGVSDGLSWLVEFIYV